MSQSYAAMQRAIAEIHPDETVWDTAARLIDERDAALRDVQTLRELRKMDAEVVSQRDEVRVQLEDRKLQAAQLGGYLYERNNQLGQSVRQNDLLQASLLRAHEETQKAQQDAVEIGAKLIEARAAFVEYRARLLLDSNFRYFESVKRLDEEFDARFDWLTKVEEKGES